MIVMTVSEQHVASAGDGLRDVSFEQGVAGQEWIEENSRVVGYDLESRMP
jgi:hypothetical protein